VPSNVILIAALTQSIENKLAWWRIEPKNSAAFRCFSTFRLRRAALKMERKVSHLNIAFDRYASIGTVMHNTLVISVPVAISDYHYYFIFCTDIVSANRRWWPIWNENSYIRSKKSLHVTFVLYRITSRSALYRPFYGQLDGSRLMKLLSYVQQWRLVLRSSRSCRIFNTPDERVLRW